jgi:hypothetical protein
LIADLGVIFEKLDTLGHVFLSNEMGLGKTKVFLTTIECRARELEAKVKTLEDGKKDIFFPTLIVNPPSTIHQTHAEIKSNFPHLTVLLYFASKSQSRKFDSARIIEKNDFLEVMKKMSNSDPQVCLSAASQKGQRLTSKTARTVVMTSYNTLHCREVLRSEKRFIFIDRKGKGPAPKRTKTAPQANTDGDSDVMISGVLNAEESQEEGSGSESDDYFSVREMLQHKAKGNEAPPKMRKYFPGHPDLKGKRIHFLRDGEKAVADGNLVEFKLARPDLARIKWEFLIVDEAHIARHVDGVFYNSFRLLNWRSLV